MLHAVLSSGDLIADRRAEMARALAENGDMPAAAEVMTQALELAPDWAAGWDLAADFRLSAGDLAGAIAAWRRLAGLDVAGVFGAELKLMAHGESVLVARTAPAYVEALFDDYAPHFEAALVERLGYRVPDLLGDALGTAMVRLGRSGFADAVDLGCGTGLMGDRVRRQVSHLEGVDLSGLMVAETQRKGVYDRVEKGELVAWLMALQRRPDLILAADVLMYCGALEPVFAAVAARLGGDGLFGFSVELHEGPEPLVLRPSLRFAHSRAGVLSALAGSGLVTEAVETAVIRHDAGVPVAGLIVVARRERVETGLADAGEADDAGLDPRPAEQLN